MTVPLRLLVPVVLLLPGSLPAQQPEKCTLAGQVTNAATGEPLKKTEVLLRRAESRSDAPYGAVTDAAGHFSIQGVEPGTYRLMADRSGFVHGEYGAHAPGRRGTVLALEPGREMTDLAIRLAPQAVITGRVLDEDGDPVANANVQAMRFSRVRGRRQLMPSTGAMTNDLGEFRLHSLAPGDYYLSALYRPGMRWRAVQSGGSASAGYAPIYYPNALNPSSAVPLHVSAGTVLPSVEIHLSRTAMVKVSGRV